MKRTKEQIEANRQKALRIKAAKAAKAQAARDNQRTEPAAQTAAAPLGPVTNTVAAPSRAARPTPPAARARPPSLPEAELFSANSLDNPRRDLDYQDFMHSPAWQPDHFPPHTCLRIGSLSSARRSSHQDSCRSPQSSFCKTRTIRKKTCEKV